MMFSPTQPRIHFEEEKLFRAMSTAPTTGPEFQGTPTMFYRPATAPVNDGVISSEPKLHFARDDSVPFLPGPQADGRANSAQTALETTTNGENGRTHFSFHDLDGHLQEDTNTSKMRQVMDDDTLSFLSGTKMVGEDAKNLTSMHGSENHAGVSAAKCTCRPGLEILEDSSHIAVESIEARQEKSNVPTALPKTHNHGMQRGKGETFTTRVHSPVCQSQRHQSREASLLPFRSVSASSAGGHSFFSDCLPFLPSYTVDEQNVTSFSPSYSQHCPNALPLLPPCLNSQEFYMPPSHPLSQKLDTVGAKKSFSSQHPNPSASGKGFKPSNLDSIDEYKIINSGNATAEYTEATFYPKTMPGKFGGLEDLISSFLPSSVRQNFVAGPMNLRDEDENLNVSSPPLTAQPIYPNCMQAMKAFTGSISNGCRIDSFGDFERSHDSSTLNHLRNKSTSSYLTSDLTDMDNPQGVSLFYSIPGSATKANESILVGGMTSSTKEGEGVALKGYRDASVASYGNAASPHSPIHIQEQRPESPLSRSLEVLDKHGSIISSDALINVTAKTLRSSTSIFAPETDCITSVESCKLTNCRKEKRWIYKQARLPKKPQYSSVDSVRMIIRKRQARSIAPKVRDISLQSISTSCALVQHNGQHKASESSSTSSSPSCKEGISFHANDESMFEEGDSIALSTSDYLE